MARKSLKRTRGSARAVRQCLPANVSLVINDLLTEHADEVTALARLKDVADGEVLERAMRAFENWTMFMNGGDE